MINIEDTPGDCLHHLWIGKKELMRSFGNLGENFQAAIGKGGTGRKKIQVDRPSGRHMKKTHFYGDKTMLKTGGTITVALHE